MSELTAIADYLVGIAGVQVLLLFMNSVIMVALFAIHWEFRKNFERRD